MSEVGRVPKRAVYADIDALPENLVGEIVNGELFASPRPRLRHAVAASRLTGRLGPPFDDGVGGPGGWWILIEPELHVGDDIVVPDLAGWRREHLPAVPDAPYLELAPDWACEILSPSTERLDRGLKLSVYAREGVAFVWLINPEARTLEVLRLHGAEWLISSVHTDDARVRATPFDAIELDLDLSGLWADA